MTFIVTYYYKYNDIVETYLITNVNKKVSLPLPENLGEERG